MKGVTRPLRFRQCICRATGCGEVFYICSRCDRGQVYCSDHCREKSRRRQRREANRRHQQSPEGRQDHQSRQRDYRKRQADRKRLAEKNVTDHGSLTPLACATIDSPKLRRSGTATWRMSGNPRPAWASWPANPVVCRVCGRSGRFINPFHEPG